MRSIITIILVVALGVGIYWYLSRDTAPASNQPQVNTPQTNEGNFQPNPSNATFTFADGPITLSGGRVERSVEPGSSFIEEIVLLDDIAYGDINDDNREDAVVLLARFGGGSGTFIYVGAYLSGPVTYRGSNTVFVGDRIIPTSLSIQNGIITINYLDRSPDQAFSEEPNVPSSLELVYTNGQLVER